MDKTTEPTDSPSTEHRELAKAALKFLKPLIPTAKPWELNACDDDENPLFIAIPPVVSRILLDALAKTAAGQDIVLTQTGDEVTTQEAARILKVSRPLVVSLIKRGELPARNVGNRLRLPLKDVLEYKAANAPKRRTPPT